MADSDFLRSDDLPGTAATGYVEVGGHWRTNVFHLPVLATGDGGMYTTSGDVSRFWRALFDGAIVRAETLASMVRDRSPDSRTRAGATAWASGYGPAPTRSPWSAPTPASRSPPSTTRRSAYTHTVIANTSDGAWPVSAELDAIVGSY